MASVTEVAVRYAETDQMGVTHHAVYPIWFEMARTDYIKNAAISYADMEKAGVMLPVTGITCRYYRPAHYDDLLRITVKITRFSYARIEFAYTVSRKGEAEILCEGTSSHGFVDSRTFSPINLKKALPEVYAKIEREAQRDLNRIIGG